MRSPESKVLSTVRSTDIKFVAEPEWPSGLQHRACCVRHGRSSVGAPNPHQCLRTRLVCGSKRLGCHADTYTVSRCRTRGESQEFIARRRKNTSEGSTPGFETQGRRHQKSKTGVSVVPPKGLMSSKIFSKRRYKICECNEVPRLKSTAYNEVNRYKICECNDVSRLKRTEYSEVNRYKICECNKVSRFKSTEYYEVRSGRMIYFREKSNIMDLRFLFWVCMQLLCSILGQLSCSISWVCMHWLCLLSAHVLRLLYLECTGT